MKIENHAAGHLSLELQQRAQDHQVQNLFSVVLAAAGREGYQSAEPTRSELPLNQQIETSWSSWFDVQRQGRYQALQNPDQFKLSFGELLVRAHEEGGHHAPKSFLSQLSTDELEVVQRVHGLADRIQVEPLTEEGALNLLLPPAAQVDLNHDGLTRSGVGYLLRFPDSRTPAPVASAWEAATADMSWGERAVYQLQMKSPILLANIKLDSEGAFSHRYEPGDPEFTNPMAAEGYSYVKATQERLDHLEVVKELIPIEQYEQQKAFWQKLKALLHQEEAV